MKLDEKVWLMRSVHNLGSLAQCRLALYEQACMSKDATCSVSIPRVWSSSCSAFTADNELNSVWESNLFLYNSGEGAFEYCQSCSKMESVSSCFLNLGLVIIWPLQFELSGLLKAPEGETESILLVAKK